MSFLDFVSYNGAKILTYRLLLLIITTTIWFNEILEHGNDFY